MTRICDLYCRGVFCRLATHRIKQTIIHVAALSAATTATYTQARPQYMATDGPTTNNGTQPPADPASSHFSWYSVSASETGFVRSVNEDAHLDARESNLWVVADGMGGHSFGDKASRTVIDQLISFKGEPNVRQSLKDLENRLSKANTLCRDHASGNIMGTTVAALYAQDDHGYFIWAGDSRIYRYRGDGLVQLTEDHSYVQELVSLGELRREDMEQHPSSNIITRAVGVHSELEIETNEALVQPGDRYLICTDGLFKDVSQDEIAGAMALVTADETLQSLVDLAMERGGRDNITAIVVQAAAV